MKSYTPKSDFYSKVIAAREEREKRLQTESRKRVDEAINSVEGTLLENGHYQGTLKNLTPAEALIVEGHFKSQGFRVNKLHKLFLISL